MKPLVFVWPYAVAFWVVLVWAFIPEFGIVSRAEPTEHAKDKGSMQLIMLGNWVAMMLAVPLAFVRSLRFPAAANLPAFIAGILLMVAGSVLRRHCWRVLGEFFTGNVQARADQPVIERGAYRWVRHPSYSGGMLMFLGIGVALASWISVAVMVLIPAIVYMYRISVEEQALLHTIGAPYADYMRRRKRIVPFVL